MDLHLSLVGFITLVVTTVFVESDMPPKVKICPPRMHIDVINKCNVISTGIDCLTEQDPLASPWITYNCPSGHTGCKCDDEFYVLNGVCVDAAMCNEYRQHYGLTNLKDKAPAPSHVAPDTPPSQDSKSSKRPSQPGRFRPRAFDD